jgi:hypothetical protein
MPDPLRAASLLSTHPVPSRRVHKAPIGTTRPHSPGAVQIEGVYRDNRLHLDTNVCSAELHAPARDDGEERRVGLLLLGKAAVRRLPP